MIYQKLSPSEPLEPFIECYWWIDSEGDQTVSEEKIIPDGFPEMIFHYADPYEVNIDSGWKPQTKALLAGQLTNHFYLRNTGASGMIGIKWKPDALNHLFQLDMPPLVDQVIELPTTLGHLFTPLQSLRPGLATKQSLTMLDDHLAHLIQATQDTSPVSKAISLIHSSQGKTDIEQLSEQLHMSSRSLERHFRKSVGLGPKFYSRIIRLNHVFEMVQSGNRDWADIVYQSGFYDQAHFIKNFKEFIGEDPSSYGFDAKNMANFHLRKQP